MKSGNEYTGPKYKQMGCKSEYKSIGSNYIHGNCTHGMLWLVVFFDMYQCGTIGGPSGNILFL